MRYYAFAQRVAGKLWRKFPSQVDLDDLVSFGVLGLIRAIERYKPDQGVAFETFAAVSIRGLILDEIRTQDWAPRSLRRKQRVLDAAFRTLETQMGRIPSEKELAHRVGWEEQEVSSTLRAVDEARHESLDNFLAGSSVSLHDQLPDKDPDPSVVHLQDYIRQRIVRLIRSFTLQEQLVIALYYYERLTLAEVGRVVGIPESRASHIHTKVMMRIRDELMQLLGSKEEAQ